MPLGVREKPPGDDDLDGRERRIHREEFLADALHVRGDGAVVDHRDAGRCDALVAEEEIERRRREDGVPPLKTLATFCEQYLRDRQTVLV